MESKKQMYIIILRVVGVMLASASLPDQLLPERLQQSEACDGQVKGIMWNPVFGIILAWS